MEGGELTVTGEQYTEEQILEGLTETARTISRLMITLLVLALFSLLAIGQPDAYLLDTAAKVNVPSIGATTAKALLIVGPLLLIGVRIYLQIYVEHWRCLDAIANQKKIKRPVVVSPMRHRVLARFTDLALYLLVPIVLVAFTWKAMALPATWGHGLFALTIFVTAVHLMQGWSRKWRARLYISAGIGTVVGVIGVLPFIDDLQRPLDLRYANIKNTDLSNVDLRRADLRQADLSGADLTEANMQEADLDEANLKGARLDWANLKKARFNFANLEGASLSRADLEGAILFGANLQRTRYFETNLKGAQFDKANLKRANISSSELTGASFKQANLEGARIIGVDMQKARLDNANLQRAELWNSNLERANLSEANLKGADLSGSSLRGASLYKALLQGAVFQHSEGDLNFEVDLREAILEKACGDERTRLPQGYKVPHCKSQPPYR